MLHVHHINLQRIVGGGEVYTHAITRAMADAGARVTLYCHPENRLWDDLPRERVDLVQVSTEDDLFARLPQQGALVVTEGPLSTAAIDRIDAAHVYVAAAHLPIVAGRSADTFKRCDLVFTVSRYCIDLLRKAGVEKLHPQPIFGTTEAQRGDGEPIVACSPYQWDRNKFRDVLLGALEPLAEPFRRRTVFSRRPGLTLGVVSLLTTIKQFPVLFSSISEVLAAREQVHLEIFGNGGYAQVRDIRRALAPMTDRARFWGYQRNVHSIYPQLDYLLAGLPDKEALGLNVLEAQMCGTPVLATDAPPFTETVLHGKSGFLFRDPREDSGADFARILDQILDNALRPDPRILAADHLKQFSYEALVDRTRALLARMESLVVPA